jgi:maleate cis-trans isomerase
MEIALSRIEFRRSQVELERDLGPVTWRIGVITLSTDAVTEHDFAAMRSDDRFRIYASRVRHINPTTKEKLARINPSEIALLES